VPSPREASNNNWGKKEQGLVTGRHRRSHQAKTIQASKKVQKPTGAVAVLAEVKRIEFFEGFIQYCLVIIRYLWGKTRSQLSQQDRGRKAGQILGRDSVQILRSLVSTSLWTAWHAAISSPFFTAASFTNPDGLAFT